MWHDEHTGILPKPAQLTSRQSTTDRTDLAINPILPVERVSPRADPETARRVSPHPISGPPPGGASVPTSRLCFLSIPLMLFDRRTSQPRPPT